MRTFLKVIAALVITAALVVGAMVLTMNTVGEKLVKRYEQYNTHEPIPAYMQLIDSAEHQWLDNYDTYTGRGRIAPVMIASFDSIYALLIHRWPVADSVGIHDVISTGYTQGRVLGYMNFFYLGVHRGDRSDRRIGTLHSLHIAGDGPPLREMISNDSLICYKPEAFRALYFKCNGSKRSDVIVKGSYDDKISMALLRKPGYLYLLMLSGRREGVAMPDSLLYEILAK